MRNDGGPAFPLTDAGGKAVAQGMCLRDYLAIRLMESILSTKGVWVGAGAESDRLEQARVAYQYADAMLKAASE